MCGEYKVVKNLVVDIAPEISKAINEIYAPEKTYINTKRICEHILENKHNYPIMSAKLHKTAMQLITLCLKKQGLEIYAGKNQGRRQGKVFVRKI